MVDGVLGFLEVGHGDEAVTFADALARLHDDVDLLHRPKGREQLPQGALRRILADVVAEDGVTSLQNIKSNGEIVSKQKMAFIIIINPLTGGT